jgi:holo-[acyl-carrier protein] synthase
MTTGVGIDLLEIGRMERAIERHPRLAERVFTADELAYARARGRRPARHLAARFAAKEAAVKALGLSSFGLREIEVVAGEPPTLRLHGRAAEAARARDVALHVSLTHSQEMAAAVVIADTA